MMGRQFFWVCLCAILFGMVDGFAQEQPNNKQRQVQQSNRQQFNMVDFWERRNTFIKTEIGLTSEEAVKFFTVENEFKQKLLEAGRPCRKLSQESQEKKKMTDAEYLKMIDCHLETRLKEAQLEKEYYEKFKKILTPEKLYRYHQADAKFTRELIYVRRTGPAGERGGERNNPDRPRNPR